MKSLFIMGTPGSGKTVVALGLAQKLQQEGYRVGYFKPVANGQTMTGKADQDSVLMKEVLGMNISLEKIAPIIASSYYLSVQESLKDAMGTIMDSYNEISSFADVLIIDGAMSIDVLGSLGLDSVNLAKKFGSKALLVLKIENDFSLDNAIFMNKHLAMAEVPTIGTIFSKVPRPLYAKTEGVYNPILEDKGYKTLGIIPTSPEIYAPTVAEYYDLLGGEILAGHDRLDNQVEDMIIGGMTLASALTYLRRASNKAVILGGDRADLALAALETSTSVLILTGGLYPDVKVIARAEELKVPIILVHYDTYTTIEKMGQVSRHIKPDDKASIGVALANIVNYCNWKYIINNL